MHEGGAQLPRKLGPTFTWAHSHLLVDASKTLPLRLLPSTQPVGLYNP